MLIAKVANKSSLNVWRGVKIVPWLLLLSFELLVFMKGNTDRKKIAENLYKIVVLLEKIE